MKNKNLHDARMRVMICKATGKRVPMIEDKYEDGLFNGHKGWLCLHDDPLEDRIEREREKREGRDGL